MSSNYIFDHVKLKVAKGELKFYGVPDGGFQIALVTSAAFDNFVNGALSDYTSWGDVSATEINVAGSGYNSDGYNGPENLINIGTFEEDVDGFTQLKVSATDISYPVSKIDADGAVVWKNDSAQTLVSAMYFGEKVSSNNGVFILNLTSKGWIRIH